MTTDDQTTLRPLRDRVAFVTGAARGQGRADAVRLARDGADIIAVDSCTDAATTHYPGATVADLERTADLVRDQGVRVLTAVVDVRDFAAMSGIVEEGTGLVGGPDVVVANAGICSANLLWEISTEQWEETIGVNLTGVFHTLKATVPGMIERGRGGSIIVISSVAGLKGQPFLGAYAASKHGVVGLVRTLANELGEHGIRVNSVHPTGVATGMAVADLMPFLERHAKTLAPMYMNTMPRPAILSPDDIAATVAWLAGEESRYITGAQIPVDLGALAR